MDWVEIISKLIVPVLCAILTAVILPSFRDKRIRDKAELLVKAAEQAFPAGSGADKYSYVREQLITAFRLTDDQARSYIEAGVYALKLAEQMAAISGHPPENID